MNPNQFKEITIRYVGMKNVDTYPIVPPTNLKLNKIYKGIVYHLSPDRVEIKKGGNYYYYDIIYFEEVPSSIDFILF